MSCVVPMKKPKNCYEYGGCPLFDRQYRVCKVAKVDYYDFDKQYANCPLIELPPHGRLGDLDKLKADHSMKNDCAECDKELQRSSIACEYDRIYSKMDFCQWIDNAETVIEGSETDA